MGKEIRRILLQEKQKANQVTRVGWGMCVLKKVYVYLSNAYRVVTNASVVWKTGRISQRIDSDGLPEFWQAIQARKTRLNGLHQDESHVVHVRSLPHKQCGAMKEQAMLSNVGYPPTAETYQKQDESDRTRN